MTVDTTQDPPADSLSTDPIRNHHVIIVHGTWGNDDTGTCWYHCTQHGNTFADKLKASLQTRITEGVWKANLASVSGFTWSPARNEDSDRRSAARRLYETLLSIVLDDPRATIHLIAHSHGGNVVLKALETFCAERRRQLVSRIPNSIRYRLSKRTRTEFVAKLLNANDRIAREIGSITTLGTPFLEKQWKPTLLERFEGQFLRDLWLNSWGSWLFRLLFLILFCLASSVLHDSSLRGPLLVPEFWLGAGMLLFATLPLVREVRDSCSKRLGRRLTRLLRDWSLSLVLLGQISFIYCELALQYPMWTMIAILPTSAAWTAALLYAGFVLALVAAVARKIHLRYRQLLPRAYRRRNTNIYFDQFRSDPTRGLRERVGLPDDEVASEKRIRFCVVGCGELDEALAALSSQRMLESQLPAILRRHIRTAKWPSSPSRFEVPGDHEDDPEFRLWLDRFAWAARCLLYCLTYPVFLVGVPLARRFLLIKLTSMVRSISTGLEPRHYRSAAISARGEFETADRIFLTSHHDLTRTFGVEHVEPPQLYFADFTHLWDDGAAQSRWKTSPVKEVVSMAEGVTKFERNLLLVLEERAKLLAKFSPLYHSRYYSAPEVLRAAECNISQCIQ